MMNLATNLGIKVLRDGASWHGGEHAWSLPATQPDGTVTPGEWTPAVTPLLCSAGWHLTTEPARWWDVETTVRAYLAEWDGAVARTEDQDKFAVERCRLLRELTTDELATCGVSLSGEHEARAGFSWAYGSSTVRAYGSSTVMASGSSTVMAYDSSTVTAYGSSTVTASGSSKTHAAGCSTATAWSGTTVVTRAEHGCIVDRRGGTPKTYLKRAGLDGWRYADGAWVQRKAKRGPVTR